MTQKPPWPLRALRVLTRHYPTRLGAHALNSLLGRIGFDRPDPRWSVVPASGGLPSMVLNVASAHERKVYLFPTAYGRMYRTDPLCDFLREVARPGSIVLDVGANIGFFSMLAGELVGSSGRVYAFEPEPLTCESLRRNLAHNQVDQVEVVPVALADRSEVCSLYCPRTSPSSSLVAETGERAGRYVRSVAVTTRTLDDWAREIDLAVDAISAIKIDVEGAEARTVAGALPILREAKLPPLWIEVRGPKGSTRAPNTFGPILEMLRPLGYRAVRWGDPERRSLDASAVQTREDVAFVAS